MKKPTTFYDQHKKEFIELLNSWSRRFQWKVVFVGASDVEHFLASYHNALLNHVVKRLSKETSGIGKLHSSLTIQEKEWINSGSNATLKQVRQVLEEEKIK